MRRAGTGGEAEEGGEEAQAGPRAAAKRITENYNIFFRKNLLVTIAIRALLILARVYVVVARYALGRSWVRIIIARTRKTSVCGGGPRKRVIGLPRTRCAAGLSPGVLVVSSGAR